MGFNKGKLSWMLDAHDQIVHPIFAYDDAKFTIFRKEYLDLYPIFLYASLFITSPAAMKFWHARIFGEQQMITNEKGESLFVVQCDDKVKLTNKEYRKVERRLLQLAPNVRFELHHGEEDCNRWAGQCTAWPGRKAFKGHGHGSVISLSSKLTQAYLKETDENVRIQRAIHVAGILAHEFAHAVHFAVSPDFPHEHIADVFVGDDTFQESGYALESRLFGGVRLQINYENGTLGTVALPFYELCTHYYGPYKGVATRLEPNLIDSAWEIPPWFLERLASKSFWNHVFSRRSNRKALFFPKNKDLKFTIENFEDSKQLIAKWTLNNSPSSSTTYHRDLGMGAAMDDDAMDWEYTD